MIGVEPDNCASYSARRVARMSFFSRSRRSCDLASASAAFARRTCAASSASFAFLPASAAAVASLAATSEASMNVFCSALEAFLSSALRAVSASSVAALHWGSAAAAPAGDPFPRTPKLVAPVPVSPSPRQIAVNRGDMCGAGVSFAAGTASEQLPLPPAQKASRLAAASGGCAVWGLGRLSARRWRSASVWTCEPS